MNNQNKKINYHNKNVLPLLPLRDLVVFPYMIVPLFIGREQSINSLEEAVNSNSLIFVVSQKDPEVERPDIEDLYSVGTIAKMIQIYKLPDDTIKVLLEGISRAKIVDAEKNDNVLRVKINKIKTKSVKNLETEALMRLTIKEFEQYLKLNDKLPSEIMFSITNIEKPDKLADLVASNLILRVMVRPMYLRFLNSIPTLSTWSNRYPIRSDAVCFVRSVSSTLNLSSASAASCSSSSDKRCAVFWIVAFCLSVANRSSCFRRFYLDEQMWLW